ncbi:hypothetical protein PCANB_002455 [Pneumocystis canis]|nr:hypothetical protein PCANB_002455 [Pneumocystis canis]
MLLFDQFENININEDPLLQDGIEISQYQGGFWKNLQKYLKKRIIFGLNELFLNAYSKGIENMQRECERIQNRSRIFFCMSDFNFCGKTAFFKRKKVKNDTYDYSSSVNQCFDKMSVKRRTSPYIMKVPFNVMINAYGNNEFMKYPLKWSPEEICRWLYENGFNIDIQGTFLGSNISGKSFSVLIEYDQIMRLFPFQNQEENIRLYYIINKLLSHNMFHNEVNFKKKSGLHVLQRDVVLLRHNNDFKLLPNLFCIESSNDRIQNSDLKNVNVFNSYEVTMFNQYWKKILERHSIFSYKGKLYHLRDLLEKRSLLLKYLNSELIDLIINKNFRGNSVRNDNEKNDIIFELSLLEKDQFETSLDSNGIVSCKNINSYGKNRIFQSKSKILNSIFIQEFFGFLRERTSFDNIFSYKSGQNVRKYKRLTRIGFNKFLNNINTILNIVRVFLHISESCTEFGNMFSVLKNDINELIRIVHSAKDKEAFIIIFDLIKCVNVIDVRKQLFRKHDILKLWSECLDFAIEIYNGNYDGLDDEALILIRFYIDNFGILILFVKLSLFLERLNAKLSDTMFVYSESFNDFKRSNQDEVFIQNNYRMISKNISNILSILVLSIRDNYSRTCHFSGIFPNILDEKIFKSNEIQGLYVSTFGLSDDSDSILAENSDCKLKGKRKTYTKNGIKLVDSFYTYKNNQDISFLSEDIGINSSDELSFLLDQKENFLKYSEILNKPEFFKYNNERRIGIGKLQLSAEMNTNVVTNSSFVIYKTFSLNSKKEFIRKSDIFYLNERFEKLHKKVENAPKKYFGRNNNITYIGKSELKRATYDFQDIHFLNKPNNQYFCVYDQNTNDFLSIKKSFNQGALGSKKIVPKASSLIDVDFSIFSDMEEKNQFKRISNLSDNDPIFIDKIENEQEMFWAVKPKKIVNEILSKKLKDDVDCSLNYKLKQNTLLNPPEIRNILNTCIEKLLDNKFTKFSLAKNIENHFYNFIPCKSSKLSFRNISEGTKIYCGHDRWGIRPSTQVVYEHLEDFFPNYDLDKPIINQLVYLTHFFDTENGSDAYFAFLRLIFLTHYVNIQNCMKSIKILAKEANEAQKRYENSFEDEKYFIPRRKSTKLWGIKLQEMKLNKDGNDYNSMEMGNIKITPTFKWIKGKLIGKGRYGKVYLAMNAITGEMLAVKQVKIYYDLNGQNYEYQKELINALNIEIETMKDLDHPNIVQYLGYERTKTTISIFLEYVSGGSIGRCLRKYGKIDKPTIQLFTRQILEGLTYLHSRGILHRDLKTDNILLDVDGICKISDFGISKKSKEVYDDNASMSMQGTIFWMAPEVIQNRKQGYSAKIDIWSLGCLVLEMFAGKRPWSNDEAIGAMFKLGNMPQAPPIPEDIVLEIKDDALDFLSSCFIVDPSIRPTAQALLKHPFIRNLDSGFRFSDSLLSRMIRTE